jgi:hypothetical protein
MVGCHRWFDVDSPAASVAKVIVKSLFADSGASLQLQAIEALA